MRAHISVGKYFLFEKWLHNFNVVYSKVEAFNLIFLNNLMLFLKEYIIATW